MFDKDINFLPSDMKDKLGNKKKIAPPSPQVSVSYTKPTKPTSKGPESKIIPPGAAPPKANFFQRIGRLFQVRKNPQSKTSNLKPQTSNLQPPIKPAPLQTPSFSVPSAQPARPKMKEAGVNLIPSDIAIGQEFKGKIIILIITIVITGLLLGLAFFSVRVYAESYAGYHNSAKDQLAVLEERIKSYQEYQLQSQETSQKVELVTHLIKGHTSWLNLFGTLEDITYADVRYTNFLGDITGQITVDVIASSFESLAQQLLVFKNSEHIEEIDFSGATKTVESGGSSEEGEEEEEKIPEVNFNLILKLNPQVFLPADDTP